MWKVNWLRRKHYLQKEHIKVSSKLTINSRKTGRSRGNSWNQSTWKVSKANPNENCAKRSRHSNGWLNKYQNLEEQKNFATAFSTHRKTYTIAEKYESFYREAEKVDKELGLENLDDSRKQALCSKQEQLVTKLDSSHAAIIQIVKSEFSAGYLTNLSKHKNYFQDLLKQHQQTAESGNQTSLVSSTSAADKDPKESVIDTGNGALENAENLGVSSRHFATQGSRKQPSIANSRSSRRRQIEEMELKNLRAKKETEQRPQERQLELTQEREEIEFRRQQEKLRLQQQQEEELRLKIQQQEDELRLRQHERALENGRKKAGEEKEQRRLKLELNKGSSRASESVADEIECVGSRRNHEKTAGWAESVAQQSVPRQPLSPNVVIDPPTNVTQDSVDKRFSTYPKTTPRFQPGEGIFSTQLTEPSILKKPEIGKPIRVTDPPAPLTRTTFQQREAPAVQDRNRSQSPINNSRNRSAESRNRRTIKQTNPYVTYQPVTGSGASGLTKLKLTEF